MKIGKVILISLGVLVLVAGIVVWQAISNIDSIVADVIENVGSDVVGTEVAVSNVEIDLKGGKATISGLTIENPEGFSNKYIFSMDDVAVDIELASLGKSPIVINEILIRQPKVFFEVDKNNVSNMDVLLKNMENEDSSKEKKEEARGDGGEIEFIIKKFRFDGGNLSVQNSAEPDKNIDQKLPVIAMDNLGAAQGGATGQEIAREMIRSLTSQVAIAAIRAGVGKAAEKEKEKLMDRASDNIKGLFKK